MQPKVSIIVCCFNEEENILFRTLQSIKTQDYENTEVFVIDDSGEEKFKTLVQKNFPSFSYVPSVFQNNAMALNLGLFLSTGNYVAILDGDDEWIHPRKITLQVHFLENNKTYSAIGTGIEIQYPDGRKTTPDFSQKEDISRKLLLESPICHSSVLIKSISLKSVMKKNSHMSIFGAYDPVLKRGKDWDLLLSLGIFGKLGIIPEICTRYYQNQSGKRWYDSWNGIRTVLKHRKNYPYWMRAFFIQVSRFIIFFILEKMFKYKRV